jgi:hypothetical protein
LKNTLAVSGPGAAPRFGPRNRIVAPALRVRLFAVTAACCPAPGRTVSVTGPVSDTSPIASVVAADPLPISVTELFPPRSTGPASGSRFVLLVPDESSTSALPAFTATRDEFTTDPSPDRASVPPSTTVRCT